MYESTANEDGNLSWERVWVHDAPYGTAFCEARAEIVRPPRCDEIDDATHTELEEIWPALFEDPASLRFGALISYATQYAVEYSRDLPPTIAQAVRAQVSAPPAGIRFVFGYRFKERAFL